MRFEGKLTERWGRKATGLRDSSADDSGVAGANLKPSSGRGLCAGARLFGLHTLSVACARVHGLGSASPTILEPCTAQIVERRGAIPCSGHTRRKGFGRHKPVNP